MAATRLKHSSWRKSPSRLSQIVGETHTSQNKGLGLSLCFPESPPSPSHSPPSTSPAIPFIFALYYSCHRNSLFANYHPTSNKSIVYKLLYRPSSISMCQDYLCAHKFLVRFTVQTPSSAFYTWKSRGSVNSSGLDFLFFSGWWNLDWELKAYNSQAPVLCILHLLSSLF